MQPYLGRLELIPQRQQTLMGLRIVGVDLEHRPERFVGIISPWSRELQTFNLLLSLGQQGRDLLLARRWLCRLANELCPAGGTQGRREPELLLTEALGFDRLLHRRLQGEESLILRRDRKPFPDQPQGFGELAFALAVSGQLGKALGDALDAGKRALVVGLAREHLLEGFVGIVAWGCRQLILGKLLLGLGEQCRQRLRGLVLFHRLLKRLQVRMVRDHREPLLDQSEVLNVPPRRFVVGLDAEHLFVGLVGVVARRCGIASRLELGLGLLQEISDPLLPRRLLPDRPMDLRFERHEALMIRNGLPSLADGGKRLLPIARRRGAPCHRFLVCGDRLEPLPRFCVVGLELQDRLVGGKGVRPLGFKALGVLHLLRGLGEECSDFLFAPNRLPLGDAKAVIHLPLGLGIKTWLPHSSNAAAVASTLMTASPPSQTIQRRFPDRSSHTSHPFKLVPCVVPRPT